MNYLLTSPYHSCFHVELVFMWQDWSNWCICQCTHFTQSFWCRKTFCNSDLLHRVTITKLISMELILWQKASQNLSFQEEPVAQAPNLSVQVTPRPHAQMSREVAGCGPGVTLTIQELGALRVAFLHLLALVRSRLHVAVGHGKHGCPRLHQELAHLHVIAGCCTVQGGPARQG